MHQPMPCHAQPVPCLLAMPRSAGTMPACYATLVRTGSLNIFFVFFNTWKYAGNRKQSAKIHATGLAKHAAG